MDSLQCLDLCFASLIEHLVHIIDFPANIHTGFNVSVAHGPNLTELLGFVGFEVGRVAGCTIWLVAGAVRIDR